MCESEVTAQILISALRRKKTIFHPFCLIPKAGPQHSWWMPLTFRADVGVKLCARHKGLIPTHAHTCSQTHTVVTVEPFIVNNHAGNLATIPNLYVINAMFVVCFCRMVKLKKETDMKGRTRNERLEKGTTRSAGRVEGCHAGSLKPYS